MTLLRRRWRTLALWGAVSFMLLSVVRTALAEPDTVPRAEDVEAAKRIVPSDGADLRVPRPPGDWIGGLGVVEPAQPERRLVPAVAGRIAAVHVEEGAFVEAGALLVELETDAERAALAAAEAEVVSAEVEVRRVGGSARTEDVQALIRDAEAATVRAEAARSVLERLEATAASGGVTRDELDRARRTAEQEQLAAEASAARRRSAEQGRPVDLRLAEARLGAARARAAQAAAAVDARRIVAPIAGEILELYFRVGEYVQPGGAEPVVVMGDTRTLTARIDVDERDVDRVVAGGKAVVTVDALPGRPFSGTVVDVARRMGRKNLRTDEPTERIDTKILEVVVDLGANEDLIVGQRVMGFLERGR